MSTMVGHLMSSLWLWITFLTTFSYVVDGSNILFFQPYGSLSHTGSIIPALEGLAIKGGHNVTLLAMFSPKTPVKGGVNVLPLNNALTWLETENINMFSIRGFDWKFLLYFLEAIPNGVCRSVLADPNFQRVVADKSTKYDVIIVDPLFSECGISLVYLLGNPPLIYYCTTWLYSLYALSWEIPTPLSYVPMNFVPFTDKMTFTQRLLNLISHVSGMAYRRFYLFPTMEAMVRQVYPDVPSLSAIEQNVSFVFSNSYSPSLDYSRPLAPFYAEVGGIHCRPAKPLPKELEDFIQGAGDDGFIYFSLGTNIQGVHLPKAFIDIFLGAFAGLKQRVIWKFEDKLIGLPSNVRVYRWLSQQDLLGHPKIKAFITQGGQLSIQEAVYHGTPILGLPVLGEQVGNVKNIVEKGLGEQLDFDNLNETLIYDALTRIIANSSYKKNSHIHSKLMHDRPMDPIDTIVYWVGYVIRHKGAPHLRLNPGRLNFFQYFLLDVIAFIFVSLALTILIIVTVIKWTSRMICGRRSKSTTIDKSRSITKKLQ